MFGVQSIRDRHPSSVKVVMSGTVAWCHYFPDIRTLYVTFFLRFADRASQYNLSS